MGSWGDVIYGAEVRTDKNGIPKANYATVMLKEPYGTGRLECRLVVYGDTDQEALEYDLVAIQMDQTGLKKLAQSAMSAAFQMDTYGDDERRHADPLSDEELVRTFNEAANEAIDAAGCDGECDPDCIYTGTTAGIRAVKAALADAKGGA